MNLYMDSQPLLGAKNGIYHYVLNLIRFLDNIDDLNLYCFTNNFFKIKDISEGNSFKKTDSCYPYRVIRKFFGPNIMYNYPFDLFRNNKSSIFHGTNFTHVPSLNQNSVITIHDLAYMRYPDTTSAKIYKHHTRWVPYSARQASRIIADSEQTKKDIVELLHIDDEKVDVVYLAADDRFVPKPVTCYQKVLNQHGIPEHYILFVGTIEPRKNLIGLLKAYLTYKKNVESPLKLVIVGAKGWKYSPIFDWVKENKLDEDVIFTGFIEDEDLVSVYNGATVFIMPSLYEGFGIPILEAMACGIPVIGSDVSSIPEVIGDSGILVGPHDHEKMAQHIYSLTTDDKLHQYYSNKSLERAKQFSWEKTAYETKKIYDKILNS